MMKNFLLATLTFIALSIPDCAWAKVPPPAATEYYTIMDGTFTGNIWSLTSHLGASCSCSPDNSCDIDIPANAVVHIKHIVTTSCNINIGNNATIVIESGGSLVVTGNAGISGTGFFQIDAGGSASVSGNFSVTGTGDATINGSLTVGGTLSLTSAAGSTICGSGTITVVGGVTGSPDPCYTGSLPIELVSFTAELKQQKVELVWATAAEINNHYFTVERSTDATHWETVSVLPGAGTTNEFHTYAEIDPTPFAGVSYYRLKQTDYDGQSDVSKTVVVYNTESMQNVILFPNPNDGTLVNIELGGLDEEDVFVTITDVVGKEYYYGKYITHNNSASIKLNLQSLLSAGTYVVRMTNGTTAVQKLLIVK